MSEGGTVGGADTRVMTHHGDSPFELNNQDVVLFDVQVAFVVCPLTPITMTVHDHATTTSLGDHIVLDSHLLSLYNVVLVDIGKHLRKEDKKVLITELLIIEVRLMCCAVDERNDEVR